MKRIVDFIRMKKKIFLIVGIAIVALVTILIVVNSRSKESREGVSRYEWIQMLSNAFSMNEYQETEPYYSDVQADNPYFAAVQSAYEWGITPKEESFDGDRKANGEYIALTEMKAIGKYKVQIYLGLTDEPTDEQYLQVADEMGLVTRSQIKSTFTTEQCESVIDRAKEMFLDDLWVDDFVKVDYQEGTVILSEEDFQELPEDEKKLKLTREASDGLGVGVTIVYPDKNGLMAAGVVSEIGTDGTVTVVDADCTKVVQSMILSDIEEITVDDFLEAYGIDRSQGKPLDDNDISLLSADEVQGDNELLTWTQNIPLMNEAGMSFIVHGDLDHGDVSVELVDNATDTKFDLPLDGKISHDDETENSVEIAVGVKNILVGAQVVSNGMTANYSDPDYIDIQCSSDVEIKGSAKFHAEKEIPLQAISLHLGKDAKGNSLFAIDLGFFLKFEADGTIELKVSFPQNASVVYEKNVGVRYPQFNIGNPSAEVKAECDLGAYIEFKAMLEIFKHKLINFSIEGGVLGRASVTVRSNSDITACADLQVYFPIVKIEFGVDVVVFEINKEFPILSPDNAPIHLGMHVEQHQDGTVDFPPKCTYNENEKTSTNGEYGKLIEALRGMGDYEFFGKKMRDWTAKDLESYCESNGEIDLVRPDDSTGYLPCLGENSYYGIQHMEDGTIDVDIESHYNDYSGKDKDVFTVFDHGDDREDSLVGNTIIYGNVNNGRMITEFSGGDYPLLDADDPIDLLESLGYDELAAFIQQGKEGDRWWSGDLGEGMELQIWIASGHDYLVSIVFYDKKGLCYRYVYEDGYNGDEVRRDLVIEHYKDSHIAAKEPSRNLPK